jgi:hypothetical protein
MEQLVLLLVIAAISLINWLIERSAKLREQKRLQKESSRPEVSAQHHREEPIPEVSQREQVEDHMRRMLESFGFPVEEPSPVEVPHPARAAADFFEEAPAPPPLPKPFPAASAPRATLRRTQAATTTSRPRSPWLTRLGSPQGLREAVVLREILGPPKAFTES